MVIPDGRPLPRRFGPASPAPLERTAVAGRPSKHRRRQRVLLQQTV